MADQNPITLPDVDIDPIPDAAPSPLPAIVTGTATPTLAPGTGTATPRSAMSDIPLTAEQRSLSLKVSLADLTARASAIYAQKNYEEAAEAYAQAAEMQAEMNGEMAPENAEILFLYGRSLFRVGQANSDVLGGRAPAIEGQGKPKKKAKKNKKPSGGTSAAEVAVAGSSKDGAAADKIETPEADKIAQEAVKIIADETSRAKAEKKEVEAKKPLFQFTGDENWDDSNEEEEEEEGDEADGEEDEEPEDDLATAFEVLDLARVLLKKQLEDRLAAADTSDGKGKEVANGDGDGGDATIKHLKERLADTHDLLAEISLENERYPSAMIDARESLKYKQDLHPEDSEIVAEAHFKLSLALEFASVTSQGDEDGGGAAAAAKEVNQELRDDAVKEMEAAIASTKLKLQNKEVELATLHSPEDNEATRKAIANTKELIADMEQRLVDLRGPPIDVQAALGSDPMMGGILGAALGESAAETEARIEEAKKTATDLTGLVRKKGKASASASTSTAAAAASETANSGGGGGKRKAEEQQGEAEGGGEATKKARTEVEETAPTST